MNDFDPFAGRTLLEEGRVVETDRVNLWCHDTGGDKEPLMLLSGFTAGHFGFDFVRPYLQDDYRLITWDPRGLGGSDRPDPAIEPYGPAVWADDLRALLDALGIERTHVWGHGFGAFIALRFAAEHPDRIGALITYTDVWAGDPAKGYPQIWEVYSAIVRNFGTTGFGARVLANIFDVSDIPWFARWEARNIEETLHPETVAATVGYCLTEADVRDDLPRIKAPALVVQGDRTWDGRTHSVEDDASIALMRSHLDLEVVNIAGAHPAYVVIQEPRACADAVRGFLSQHPLARP
jgi:3-oxoadipate enol-lactonase